VKREAFNVISLQVREWLYPLRILLRPRRIARNVTKSKGEHLFLYSGLKASQRDGKVWLRGRGAHISIDRQKKEIQAWLGPGAMSRRLWLSQVVLPLCFIEILRARGCFYFHAACLRSPSGKVWLFPGNSGSGKTTLTRKLVKYGYNVLSDDAVVIRREKRGSIRVVPFRDLLWTGHRPINGVTTFKIMNEAKRVDRIGFLSLRPDKKTHLTPLNPSEALAKIIPSSPHVLSSKHDSLPHLDLLRILVQGAKCFTLTFGKDAIKFPFRFAQRLNTV